MVVAAGGTCTGTLVHPRVVLTAAHCLEGQTNNSVDVRFGSEAPFETEIDSRRIYSHRFYVPSDFTKFDVGFILLQEDAPAEVAPLSMYLEPLDESMIGNAVRAVGFGLSDGVAETGAGVKRTVDLTFDGLDIHTIVVGDDEKNTCRGDSGGPLFMDVGGEEQIIGVTSYGFSQCMGASRKARLDIYGDLIDQVIEGWVGPCGQDGTCVTEGCKYLDPDCDPCGFDGLCIANCETVDIDCSPGKSAGQLSDSYLECESRILVEAPEDSRVSFCSTECQEDSDCVAPLGRCAETSDGQRCFYDGYTPSVQGAGCFRNEDCRSMNCDTAVGICVEACGAGGTCDDGFVCRSVNGIDSCSESLDQGCCGGTAPPVFSALVLLAFILIRRL